MGEIVFFLKLQYVVAVIEPFSLFQMTFRVNSILGGVHGET